MSSTPSSPSFPQKADGLVLTYFSDFYTVQKVNGDLLQCKRKALLKKQGLNVVVGDFVTVEDGDSQLGWITGVLPPTTILSKPKIHNISHVLIACPWQEPSLDLRQIDRLLAKVQLSGLSPLLVFTKADINPEFAQQGFTLAEWIHYYSHFASVPTLATSIYDLMSIERLKTYLSDVGGRWVLAGVSGAGKSSLLNVIDPKLNLKVHGLSHKGGRGTHTTRHTELLKTLNGLWIADAPGFSQLDFSNEVPTLIQNAFIETRSSRPLTCTYEDCLHLEEHGCVIKEAVNDISFLPSRYLHYVELVKEAQAGESLRLTQSQKSEVQLKQGKSKKGGKVVHVVKLNPELRQANRKENRQALKKLEQHILHQQNREDDLEHDENPLNHEDF